LGVGISARNRNVFCSFRAVVGVYVYGESLPVLTSEQMYYVFSVRYDSINFIWANCSVQLLLLLGHIFELADDTVWLSVRDVQCARYGRAVSRQGLRKKL
jgi:hypothetical protein